MITIGSIVDNRTICDLFGVANMGGIRVSKKGRWIVLVSNNTDPTYSNEWKDGVLHFVGRGSTGPQKLDRQNRTLANANRSGMALHLFEVFEKGRYVYAGEVELVGEPEMSDQPDRRAEDRFVWVFRLQKKPPSVDVSKNPPEESAADHLPYGAYAVIDADLSAKQVDLVNEALDRLKEAGVAVFDQRDVDSRRYDKALADWCERVLIQARSIVKERISRVRQAAKARNGGRGVIDDELNINAGSTEADLRAALAFCDGDDREVTEGVFEEARRRVPMPEMPESMARLIKAEPMSASDLPARLRKTIDRSRFDVFK